MNPWLANDSQQHMSVYVFANDVKFTSLFCICLHDLDTNRVDKHPELEFSYAFLSWHSHTPFSLTLIHHSHSFFVSQSLASCIASERTSFAFRKKNKKYSQISNRPNPRWTDVRRGWTKRWCQSKGETEGCRLLQPSSSFACQTLCSFRFLDCARQHFQMAKMACPAPSVLPPTLCTITNSSSNSPTSVVAGRGYGESLVRTSTHLRNSFCQVGMGPCITRHGSVADLWSDRIARRKSRNVAGPINAMVEETMWITASSAVALVVALAGFAALGGYLLSMGVDNEERGEVEKIEKLKEQGLYEKPEPTQYEEQGVATRTRKRRITED